MEECNLKQIGERLKDLREIFGYTTEYTAKELDVTEETYIKSENGECDLPISFLHKAAKLFSVDITDIILGEAPTLSLYHAAHRGDGLPVEHREGFAYRNMAYLFKDRRVEPFIVVAPYSEKAVNSPISLSVHDGQEFDLVLKGTLKMVVNDKTEILHAGESIYLNSRYPHGMIAIDGEDCEFLAVVIPDGTI